MLKYPEENDFKIPVCISDLPSHQYIVSPATLTETVVTELETRPELPGVLIVDRHHRLLGLLTRLKLFERLGHRYGVELFLRKPIYELGNVIGLKVQTLPGPMRVDEAVQYALGRPAADIYDPVVVQIDTQLFSMLEINVLLLAQSRTVSNLSNVVAKLQQIDTLIYLEREREAIFNQMLALLGQVVPYHQAAIVLREKGSMHFAATAGYARDDTANINSIRTNQVYTLMHSHRQAIYLPEACLGAGWQGMEALGQPLAWLGIPLIQDDQPLGMLSLGRNISSAFTMAEKETAQAFANRIVAVLMRKSAQLPGSTDFAPGTFFFDSLALAGAGKVVCEGV